MNRIHDAGRKGDWMQTFTGLRFYPADPRAEDVNLIDIAHALGHISRYGGHCTFYSVAEHSVLVSHMVPPEHAFAGLMHDASEAYVMDLIRPLKRVLGKDNPLKVLEARVYAVLADKYGLPAELPPCVKEADVAICGLERRELHPRADEWDLPFPIPKLQIKGYSPYAAADLFLVRFGELTGTDMTETRRQYYQLYQDSLPGRLVADGDT